MGVVATFDVDTSARDRLLAKKAEHDRLEQEMQDLAVTALKQTCQEIFLKHPDLESFAWIQYKGEYNDDGPHHGVNGIAINHEWDEESPNYSGNRYVFFEGAWNHSGVKVEIFDAITELGEEILMKALGGYHQVTVTRQSISVDHYEGW